MSYDSASSASAASFALHSHWLDTAFGVLLPVAAISPMGKITEIHTLMRQ